MAYLKDIPQEAETWGVCKTLLCRRETIHIKHLMTEIFVKKSINLDTLGIDVYNYMAFLTIRLRKIYKFDRTYNWDIDKIINFDRQRFFPSIESLRQLQTKIILDFDGVCTDKRFHELYSLCIERCPTVICSANPTITTSYWHKRELPSPRKIFSNRGKKKKINKLIDLIAQNDFVFYVDDEIEYLDIAYVYGAITYHWDGKTIRYYTLQK